MLLYQDDDATTVVTEATEVDVGIAERVGLRAGYVVDATTTASVDVVAAATQRWDERRHELRGGADVHFDSGVMSASYGRSWENDYASHRMSLGGSVDVADKAATLAASIGLVLSDVQRADDPNFDESQTAYSLQLRWVQAISPKTLGALAYRIQRVVGYQSSPYRYVPISGSFYSIERHPRERLRHSIVGRIRHSLSDAVALGIDERFYIDDWGVIGTTTVLQLSMQLSTVVDLVLRERVHFQDGASFFREDYGAVQRYISNDRELSRFVDSYTGFSLGFTGRDLGPFTEVRVDLRSDFFVYRFFEFPYLDRRIGFLAGLGFEVRR